MERLTRLFALLFIGVFVFALIAVGPLSHHRSDAKAAARARTPADTVTDLHWVGAVAPGAWVRIHDITGTINVEPADGKMVEVRGQKIRHGDDPNGVRMVAERAGTAEADVAVCALWDAATTCAGDDEKGGSRSTFWHRLRTHTNDTQVDFTIRLPKGVNLQAHTVDGDVVIDGATGEVDATTIDGGARATGLTGPATVTTVDGDVDVRMASLAPTAGSDGDTFKTVDGSVTLYLPAQAAANVDLKTVNGHLQSDFPVTTDGSSEEEHGIEVGSHKLHGTIGAGGTAIRAETINGSVSLHRGS
jgi:hypothetical protein